ncbi:MAG: RNA polymerase sigma factor [Planctomycetota bacterium]
MSHLPAEKALDELLVLTCRAGGHEAFVALHERWHHRLLAHAGTLLGRRFADRADDVCQEAWLAIANGIAALGEPRHFRAWAYSIVTRRVADQLRTLGRSERAAAELRRESVNQSLASDDSRTEHEALRRALDTLSSEDRALLRLFYLDELSVAETAEALAVPIGTVKSRLFHARQRLRRALQLREP